MNIMGARAGAFPCSWAGSSGFEPVTIHSFSFSIRLGKFVENSRKIIKNMRPILLDS
jgi:hypothetical protein